MWRAIPAMLAWKCPTRKWADFRLWEKFVAFPLRQVFRFRANGIKSPESSSDSLRIIFRFPSNVAGCREKLGDSSKNIGAFSKNVGVFSKNVGENLENVGAFLRSVGKKTRMELGLMWFTWERWSVLSYEICRCRNENFGNSKYMCKFVRVSCKSPFGV